MNSRRLLRGSDRGSRNTFTVGSGHHPGATPGAAGKAGKPVFLAGAWYWRGGAWRRDGWATGRSGAARPDKAPFISYMKGALLHTARPGSLHRRDTPAQHEISG